MATIETTTVLLILEQFQALMLFYASRVRLGRSSEAKDRKKPKKVKCDGRSDGRTDGRTDGPTDGPTDRQSGV